MLKRHLRQQRAVEEYGRNIKQLAGRAQGLLAAGHPEGCVHQLGSQARASPPSPQHQDPFKSSGKTGTVFLESASLRKVLSGAPVGPVPFRALVLCG